MNEFFVGQRVVCVDDNNSPGFVWVNDAPVVGNTYTIHNIFHVSQRGITFHLLEIERSPTAKAKYGEYGCGYGAHRFRPLESKAIQLFRKIARDVSEGKTVELVS